MKQFAAGALLCALTLTGCAGRSDAVAQVNALLESQAFAEGTDAVNDLGSMSAPSENADAANVEEADSASHWAGTYVSSANITLEVQEGDANVFAYRFSDGTMGDAYISGSTARSADETLSFLFSDDMITVIGGNLVGNYKP